MMAMMAEMIDDDELASDEYGMTHDENEVRTVRRSCSTYGSIRMYRTRTGSIALF